ncbi:HEAT repeat domain-containing protein [Natronobeatus ordinarius]|uniref:HEAT repeat domain-containing protein n=1 Tax=Natronobeatus ordinarius TaxID=2963433 RepID=UPI0020CB7D8D|nr:HEAT repeat domain-containing protein [Natronobeatus ordinarius]
MTILEGRSLLTTIEYGDEGERRRGVERLAEMAEDERAAAVAHVTSSTAERLADAALEVGGEAGLTVCRTTVLAAESYVDFPAIVERLVQLDHPDAVDVALEAYCRGDAEERATIARLLAGQLTPSLADALEAAAADPGWLSRKRHGRRLRKRFRSGTDVTRRAAALGLGALGTERSVRTLANALEDEDAVADALAGLSIAPPGLTAVPLARACRNPDIARAASETLVTAVDRLEFDVLLEDSDGHQLVDAMVAVEDSAVRARLVHAVHEGVAADVYRDREDVFETLVAAGDLPDPTAREESAQMLAFTGRAAAVDALLERFDDPDPDARAAAVEAASKVGVDIGLEYASLLESATAHSHRTAAAYGAIEETTAALPAVRERLLVDDHPAVRRAAATALGNMGDDRAVRALVWALETDPSHEVRRDVARALGRIAHPAAVPPLRRALADPEGYARSGAATAIGNPAFDHPELLVDLLCDHDDPNVRSSIAYSLAQHSPDEALDPLRTALETEPDDGVRSSIVRALGDLGEPARPAIRTALKDPSDRVAEVAAEILEKLE